MATAKRVAQDATVTGTFEKQHIAQYAVVTVNGKETGRDLVRERTDVVDNRVFTAQPDRITLDLSLEEAQAVLSSLTHSTHSKANGVYRALYALSPYRRTMPSSLGDKAPNRVPYITGSLLRAAVDPYAKPSASGSVGGAPTTPYSAISAVEAQRKAYEREVRMSGYDLR